MDNNLNLFPNDLHCMMLQFWDQTDSMPEVVEMGEVLQDQTDDLVLDLVHAEVWLWRRDNP